MFWIENNAHLGVRYFHRNTKEVYIHIHNTKRIMCWHAHMVRNQHRDSVPAKIVPFTAAASPSRIIFSQLSHHRTRFSSALRNHVTRSSSCHRPLEEERPAALGFPSFFYLVSKLRRAPLVSFCNCDIAICTNRCHTIRSTTRPNSWQSCGELEFVAVPAQREVHHFIMRYCRAIVCALICI